MLKKFVLMKKGVGCLFCRHHDDSVDHIFFQLGYVIPIRRSTPFNLSVHQILTDLKNLWTD